MKRPELDDIAVLQDMLGHPRTIEERAVDAAQVLQDVIVSDRNDDGVLRLHRRIVDHDLVVRFPADVDTLLLEKTLVNDRSASAQYKLCH